MIRTMLFSGIASVILWENKDGVARFMYQITGMTFARATKSFMMWFSKNL